MLMEIDLTLLSPSNALAIRNALLQELTWADEAPAQNALQANINDLEMLIINMMGEDYLR